MGRDIRITIVLVLGCAVAGSIIGSVLGVLWGQLFREIFSTVLTDSPTTDAGSIDRAITAAGNWSVALYALVYPGLGWLGGLVVGGVTGAVLSMQLRR